MWRTNTEIKFANKEATQVVKMTCLVKTARVYARCICRITCICMLHQPSNMSCVVVVVVLEITSASIVCWQGLLLLSLKWPQWLRHLSSAIIGHCDWDQNVKAEPHSKANDYEAKAKILVLKQALTSRSGMITFNVMHILVKNPTVEILILQHKWRQVVRSAILTCDNWHFRRVNVMHDNNDYR